MKKLIIILTIASLVHTSYGNSNNSIKERKLELREKEDTLLSDKKNGYELSKEIAEKIIKSGDDDLLRKLRSGEKLEKEVVEALIKALPSDLIAKIIVDNVMGPVFTKNIDKVINAIKKDRSRYNELIGKMDEAIEIIGSNNEFNIDLINSLKKDVTNRIDDALKNEVDIVVSFMNDGFKPVYLWALVPIFLIAKFLLKPKELSLEDKVKDKEQFEKVVGEKTNEELFTITNEKRHDYNPDFIIVAEMEIEKRSRNKK